jgi:hypothetical protein
VTDQTETSASTPPAGDSPGWGSHPSTPAVVASALGRAAAIANDRPEVAVGAAFAGGLVLALILKRLVR